MNRYNLSKRLLKVANLVEPAAFLVDIGCDHGFLAIDLVKSGKVKRALCTDINEGPLERAAEHIKEYRLGKKIGTCLSDGLLALKDKFFEYPFDACTVCGMGGLMGIKIIHEADEFFRRMDVFYLQLQSDQELVRIYLKECGYKILFEDMVFEDGKFYTVMKVKNEDLGPIERPSIFDNEEETDIKTAQNNAYKTYIKVGVADFDCEMDFDSESDFPTMKLCQSGSLSEANFKAVPAILKVIYENLDVSYCPDVKYPYYEGMDSETYRMFLEFMIDKYQNIRSFLPDDSERVPIIERELEIMKLAYERYVKIK